MTQLDTALSSLAAHPGVEHLLLLGRDGLLIRQHGADSVDADVVAAMVPGVASACTALADAAGRGGFSTAVLELEQGVALVCALSADLLLALLLRPGVGFAPLLREVRGQRGQLAELL